MDINLVNILRDSLGDPRFGPTASDALQLIEASDDKLQHLTTGRQSSAEVASIWTRRKVIGNYKKEALRGIEETIASLSEQDLMLRSGHVETERGVIALWFDGDKPTLLGLTVVRY